MSQIELPNRLSPSRMSDFLFCPEKFRLKVLLKLHEPSSVATAAGSISHAAFERIFDLPRGDRTFEAAWPYALAEWENLKTQRAYQDLQSPETEAEILKKAEESIRGWWSVERVNDFEPEQREMKVESEVGGVTVHGIIDRVDRWGSEETGWKYAVTDYKTGTPPDRNSPFYDKNMDEKFFQLRVYAVMLEDSAGISPTKLRLVFVNGATRDSVHWRPWTLDDSKATRKQIQKISADIKKCFDTDTWPLAKYYKGGTSISEPKGLCKVCYHRDIGACYGFNGGFRAQAEVPAVEAATVVDATETAVDTLL